MIWNVLVSVVDLIDAETEKEAIGTLRSKLSAAGFEPYEGDPGDAFLSEDQL